MSMDFELWRLSYTMAFERWNVSPRTRRRLIALLPLEASNRFHAFMQFNNRLSVEDWKAWVLETDGRHLLTYKQVGPRLVNELLAALRQS